MRCSRLWLCALTVCVFAAGCVPADQVPATTTLAASATPPTNTPVFIPIDTPTPTLTPTTAPTLTPTPVVISFDNAGALLMGVVSVGGRASDVVWLPDSSAVIVATEAGLWQVTANDAVANAVASQMGTVQPVTHVAANGGRVYAIAEAGVIAVDVATGAESMLLEGVFDALAISPDGLLLAAGDADGIIHLIDTTTGAETGQLVGGAVTSLVFSPDGTLLASSNVSNRVVLWELSELRSLNTFASGALVEHLAFSPDNVLLAGSIGNQVVLWFVVSGDQVVTLNGHTHTITSLAFHPTEALLATGDGGGSIILWDFITGEALTTLSTDGGSNVGVVWSADGSMLAAASGDGTVTVWSASP
jgi:WD40 repeat protein